MGAYEQAREETDERILVVDYDQSWPSRFELERPMIQDAIRDEPPSAICCAKPSVADEYAALKRQPATRFEQAREAYRGEERVFIRDALGVSAVAHRTSNRNCPM